jgi:hypothetical protein
MVRHSLIGMIMHKPENKFTWGDTVRVKDEAPKNFHPGEIVSVCGLAEISTEDLKMDPTLIEPTWLYTVEFGDGHSIEIPESYLEPYSDRERSIPMS